ncbi:leukotriene B4 receptor 1 [Rhineura floridana]|uniref:leukotriene B4 receptor 1 n=1 Tax=Rhineura floridana TaxID=261503 RepID=UPI002AC85521|nr:leukotriene B4 receptor 1 [Rhineura floridana]XP_061446339.1 leukotriene B4 receptor 1 [Rhineura floridana]
MSDETMSASNVTLNATSQVTALAPLPGAKVGLTVLSLAFILGFPGNAFVVWSASCRVRKRTVTCLLILHLAIADLAVLLTAPLFLRFLSAGRWELGDAVCRASHYICGVSMYSSVFLIALMSLDRCLAVSRPFVSQKIRTKYIIRLLVLAIWVVAIFLAIPVLVYRKVILHGRLFCTLYHPTPNHLVFHNLFETITGFLLPFVAVLYSYGTIGLRLKETRFRRKRRTNHLIGLIVVAFALFWVPYHVVNLLDVAAKWSGSENVKKAGQMARPTTVAFAFFSSSVNPILYTFSGSSFIRSAGFGFMAKLFEGTASEMSTIKRGTSRDQQLQGSAKLPPLNNESPEFLTTSTTPMDNGTPQELEDVSKPLKSP